MSGERDKGSELQDLREAADAITQSIHLSESKGAFLGKNIPPVHAHSIDINSVR
jgi:hypothetical protein